MSIRLHPQNPHYFEFKGRPVVLIGSGEHYGALLNRAFDYTTYLDTIERAGLNQTRIFAGTYREIPGNLDIKHNTLSPTNKSFLCPWKPVANKQNAAGQISFDLTVYNPKYFARLKDFIAAADKRGIIVELVLFCFFYTEELWRSSPLYNNVNNLGNCGPADVYRLYENDLLGVQQDLVRKICRECNGFDNLYYEIINEPYARFDGESYQEWQYKMIDTLVESENDLPNKHLIAQNIHNKTYRIIDPHPGVSIFNFHYATPSAFGDNYHWNRVIADDETGFAGQSESPYRREAWQTLLSGGAVFSHLDYSFSVQNPDGNETDLGNTPGYGGPELRRQLGVLKQFLERFDFINLSPHNEIIHRLRSTGSAETLVLGNPGREYAIYIWGGGRVEINLGVPTGSYRVEWVNPKTGNIDKEEVLTALAGPHQRNIVVSPDYSEDIVLRIINIL